MLWAPYYVFKGVFVFYFSCKAIAVKACLKTKKKKKQNNWFVSPATTWSCRRVYVASSYPVLFMQIKFRRFENSNLNPCSSPAVCISNSGCVSQLWQPLSFTIAYICQPKPAIYAHLSHICSWKGTSTCNFPLSISKTTFKRVHTVGRQTDGRMARRMERWRKGSWNPCQISNSIQSKEPHAAGSCCFSHLLCAPQPQNMPARQSSLLLSPAPRLLLKIQAHIWAARLIKAANCATFNGNLHSIHRSIY